MGSSLQDVFKDFDYGNDEVDDINVEDSFFYETFSQLKNEVEVETAAPPSAIETKKRAASGRRSKVVDLAEFEEAFTVLKSIQAAHEPSSITAITAFLHQRRGLQTNRRTLQGLLWPEHPETFSSSRLIEESLAATAKLPEDDEDLTMEPETIPQLYTAPSDTSDTSEPSGPSDSVSSSHRTNALHEALIRTCQSIWRQKNTLNNSTEISPHLSHVISRRCSFLLQTVFKRAHLNRRSAVRLLQSLPENRCRDLDNVPVDWGDVREAARQIVGQAALDQETFYKFKMRLDKLFKKQ